LHRDFSDDARLMHYYNVCDAIASTSAALVPTFWVHGWILHADGKLGFQRPLGLCCLFNWRHLWTSADRVNLGNDHTQSGGVILWSKTSA